MSYAQLAALCAGGWTVAVVALVWAQRNAALVSKWKALFERVSISGEEGIDVARRLTDYSTALLLCLRDLLWCVRHPDEFGGGTMDDAIAMAERALSAADVPLDPQWADDGEGEEEPL